MSEPNNNEFFEQLEKQDPDWRKKKIRVDSEEQKKKGLVAAVIAATT